MKTPNYSDEPTASLVVATPTTPSSDENPTQPPPTQGEWTCPMCTLLNPIHASICGVCSFIKDRSTSTSSPTPDAMVQPVPASIPVSTYFDKGTQPTLSSPDYRDKEENINVQELEGEDPCVKKARRRRRRRWRMAAGATAGAIVGAVVFCGPWGAIVGGVAWGVGSRVISKRGEQKKDVRLAQARLSKVVVD